MFVNEWASPINKQSFIYYCNRLWHWDGEQTWVEEYSNSNYGELRVSTFVKSRMVFLWCMMHFKYKSWYISYEPWWLWCILHNIQPSSSAIGSLPLLNPSPLAWGLSVVNFLWPRTRVVYMWDTPRSHDLYIYYIYIVKLTWSLTLIWFILWMGDRLEYIMLKYIYIICTALSACKFIIVWGILNFSLIYSCFITCRNIIVKDFLERKLKTLRKS